ncbi:MAG TPA: hypothetical protein VGB00_06335 [Pyrinomonadaceae bacterium]|jgi:hypothetical protein
MNCPNCEPSRKQKYNYCLQCGALLSPTIDFSGFPTLADNETKTVKLPTVETTTKNKKSYQGLKELLAILFCLGAVCFAVFQAWKYRPAEYAPPKLNLTEKRR